MPICSSQKRLDPLIIHHFGTVWTFTLSTKPSVSTRADDAFKAFDLLGSVITAIFCAHRGALERLGINHTCAGLGISLFRRTLRRWPIEPG